MEESIARLEADSKKKQMEIDDQREELERHSKKYVYKRYVPVVCVHLL